MWPCVVRKQISCFYHCGSSFPASSPFYLFIFKETNLVPKSSPTDSTAHSIWKASKGNILKVLQFVIKKKLKEENEKKNIHGASAKTGLAWLYFSFVCWSKAQKGNWDPTTQASSSPCSQTSPGPPQGQSGDKEADGMEGQEWESLSGPITSLPQYFWHAALAFCPYCTTNAMQAITCRLLVKCSELGLSHYKCGKCDCLLPWKRWSSRFISRGGVADTSCVLLW